MGAGFLSAVVLILVVVLVLIVILAAVLVVVLILVLVLVIHDRSSENLYLRQGRYHSVTRFLAFILRLENQAGKQACGDCRRNAAGAGLQPTGEDSKEAILLHRFFDTLGQIIAETGQRNSGTGSGKFSQRLINSDGTKKYTDEHIADEDSGGSKFGLVNQNLTDQALCATNTKCFNIVHVNPSL